MSKIIEVYEHETLRIGDVRQGIAFERRHFEALSLYNERNSNKFYTLVHKGIKFRQYVGVIQVGTLTIEILPKVDKHQDQAQWREVLFDMLHYCRLVKTETHNTAMLSFRQNSLLELYFSEFLTEVEKLLHEGLIKKYRKRTANQPVLKGSIDFPRHLNKNLVHKERFYTRHSIYDLNNRYNQVLLTAIRILNQLPLTAELSSRVKRTLFCYPDLEPIQVNQAFFERLNFDRKTERYRYAISIAKMIILNYSPDVKGGHNDLIALLFDMNKVWEDFIYRQLLKAGIAARRQNSSLFWQTHDGSRKRRIRPDIVIPGHQAIVDTKWKDIGKSQIRDSDLQQMFIYNEFWNHQKAILVYPGSESREVYSGSYQKQGSGICKLLEVNICLPNGRLNKDLGKSLLRYLD